MIAETARFKIYWKFPFLNLYVGKDLYYNKYKLFYVIYDENYGYERWKIK